MNPLARPAVVLTFAVLALSGCERSDRPYKGRSAEKWAAQLTAAAVEDRIDAAYALYHVAPQSDKIVSALVRAMNDASGDVQEAVAVALATVGARALPGLTAAIRDDHASVRELAIRLVTNHGSAAETAVPAIIEALGDTSELVRRTAATSLGSFGSLASRADTSLIRCVNNDTPDLRAACLISLSQITRDTAVIVQLATVGLRDAAAPVRRAAVRAIVHLVSGGTEKYSALLPLVRDYDTSVRVEVYKALGTMLQDPIVGPTVRATLTLAQSDLDQSARAVAQTLLKPARIAGPDDEPGVHDARIIQRKP